MTRSYMGLAAYQSRLAARFRHSETYLRKLALAAVIRSQRLKDRKRQGLPALHVSPMARVSVVYAG